MPVFFLFTFVRIMWFIEKLCMLCLESNVDLNSIYTKDVNNVVIIEKLTYAIASFENNLHDYPLYICKRCNKRLNKMYIFKQQCLKHVNYITNYILKLNPLNVNFSHLSVSLNKNSGSIVNYINSCNKFTDENHIVNNENQTLCIIEGENSNNSENINKTLKHIKVNDKINVDYGSFEAQILNSDLVHKVKDNISLEIQMEENLTEFKKKKRNIDILSNFIENENNLENSEISTGKQLGTNIRNIYTEEDFKLNYNQNIDNNTRNVKTVEICADVSLKTTDCIKLHKQEKCGIINHLKVHTRKKPFKCSICSKAYSESDYLKIHMRTHSGDKPFKCSFCTKAFINSSNLKSHMRVHKEEEKSYICNVCKKIYKKKCDIFRHLSVHTEERLSKCNICTKAFNRPYTLKVHMRSHITEKLKFIKTNDEININYDVCEVQILNSVIENQIPENIRKDTKKKLEQNSTNLCTVENLEVNDNNVKSVKTEVDEGNYTQICTVSTKSTEHNETQLFKCLICEYEFVKKCELIVHMRLHKQQKSYICNICKKVFKKKSDIIGHVGFHTEDTPFKCSICTKAFNRSNTLKNHIRTHTGFRRLYVLKSHRRINIGEKPFKCSICTKAFHQAITLKNHVRIHMKKAI